MRNYAWLMALVLLGALAASQDPNAASIERGRYLAEDAIRCQDCHTPVTETGELDRKRWMKGAVLNIQPIKPVKDWHKDGPNITPSGKLWNTWGREAMVKYLITGLNPRGRPAGPPMPAYKLKPEDAEAIIAYLETLQ
jgi:mono/diheme cytochrome c family protein